MAIDKLTFESENIATHSGDEGGVKVNIERIAPGSGILGDWDDTANATVVGLVSGLSVNSILRGRIVIGAKCETTADYFYSAFLVFKNASGTVIGVSATFSPTFKLLTDGGVPAKRYAAVQCFANECGASSVELYLTALPAGATSIDLYMAAL